MDLSVIIVNYNVKYFLEQCLHSVMKAIEGIRAEVFVVDNHSADGSVQMVRDKFPDVKLIANAVNAGFAKANNQAVRMATGRYVLLLNPDTVVQEDSFTSCISYMDSNPDAGCLGVKMIDGKGRFLPESKRALPTPAVAFYKIFGLSALFPHSHRFGKYHLGFLDKDKIHDVDVISGAYMFMRRSALEKTGLLDETFFMYGEDIDMSYRFNLAGFRNVYYPRTTIIHYKGESTRKGSINYVLVFYRAMIIFAQKHFKGNSFRLYSFLIHLAIYFRAGFSILTRFISGTITAVFDALLIYCGFLFILPLWEQHHFGYRGYYPSEYLSFAVPSYIFIWLVSIYFTTGYDKKVKLNDLVRGVLMGSLVILVIYALLPETWRFSRALIVLGSFWVIISTILTRYLLHILNKGAFSLEISRKKKRIIIIGDTQEGERVYSIIKQTQVLPELVGYVDPFSGGNIRSIGHLDQIDEIVRINQVDELIFCSASVSSEQIIRTMLRFNDSGLEFKIAPPASLSVIGSNSIDTTGELYVLHFNTLSRKSSRHKKRFLDVVISILFLVFSPVMLFMVRNKPGYFRNAFSVLAGFSSWVGYYGSTGGEHPGLPKIKKGILTPVDGMIPGAELVNQMNLSYAKDYRLTNDLRIIAHNLKNLGQDSSSVNHTETAFGKERKI
ncbi:MAG TPA: glycosyltransferase [Bacteroidales bacterium]|nr:glycosyltransferase [Bacteroidales bacterium]